MSSPCFTSGDKAKPLVVQGRCLGNGSIFDVLLASVLLLTCLAAWHSPNLSLGECVTWVWKDNGDIGGGTIFEPEPSRRAPTVQACI